eukprot:Nitzschia sp. Nitz4//scaffold12_size214221//20158//21988//NITZ4_001478-RA/size214221-augustus-gene-0.21-mRNA-1//-1//CDS//3329534954//5818//frame0
MEQEKLVSKFAVLLGTKNLQKNAMASSLKASDPSAAASQELLLCVSNSVQSHEVVCSLPSLDMRQVDEEATSSCPLPKVGEHLRSTTAATAATAATSTADGTTVAPAPAGTEGANAASGTDKPLPPMAASVLHNAADASAQAAQVEQKAAQSLGALTSWTKSSLSYAPGALAKNIADSFSSLVDSRVRAWTLLLLRHSLTTGDSASRSRLLSMLSSIIKVLSADTTFKTIPLPESAAGQHKESDVILPLLLEVDMKVSIQSKTDSVTLRAPGTISANFEKAADGVSMGPRMVKVDIRLDTGAMLDSMVQQARMIVFKAVAKATSATDAMQLEGSSAGVATGATGAAPVDTIPENSDPQSTTLAGFSSALNLSSGVPPGTHQPAHRLQKARSSALKLNSVLQGGTSKPGNPMLDKSRKTRSVQWDVRADLIKMKAANTVPTPKRQRVSDTTPGASARLQSFKSFGRPHAGDFGSGPRNATFGDFGRKPIWGRDGKLANHPAPMNPSDNRPDDLMGTTSRNTKNATFDFQRPSIHLSSGLGIGAPSRSKKGPGLNNVPKSIPRTATALEGWLMEKTGSSGV